MAPVNIVRALWEIEENGGTACRSEQDYRPERLCGPEDAVRTGLLRVSMSRELFWVS